MTHWIPVSVSVIGALAVAGVAELVGMSTAESVKLATPAVIAAGLAAVFGTFIVALLRARSIGLQTVAVALSSLTAVGVGAAIAARSMFFSTHDFGALMVILTAAGTVGIVLALVLGRRIAEHASSLGESVKLIEQGAPPRVAPARASRELRDLAGQLEHMSATLLDSRERERALDTSRRELVAWVSHDLRTPLAGIRAMAEALEDGVVDDAETVHRYHHSMRVEVDRLTGLVDDLFELSRINSGALRLQIEEVSLADLVSDAIAAAAAMARDKGVRLEGRVTSHLPAIPLSEPEMTRVLRNLLENAIRHTPSEGAVRVETGNQGSHAFVSVADACGGIPYEDIDRVFEMAFRGQSARTPDDHVGGGLGLAIVRGIVEAHNGDIDVCNDGDGCCFTIRLPLEQPVR